MLSAAFDESSCQSRYRSNLYRKPSPFPLSPYLAQKLRKYEAYHKKCGPGTKRYRRAVKQLKAGRNADHSDCKYVVWFPCNGLGNRMLSMVSGFLYALLTGGGRGGDSWEGGGDLNRRGWTGRATRQGGWGCVS